MYAALTTGSRGHVTHQTRVDSRVCWLPFLWLDTILTRGVSVSPQVSCYHQATLVTKESFLPPETVTVTRASLSLTCGQQEAMF